MATGSIVGTIAPSNITGLATVATSGSYIDLSNKPVIPAAQVNSDWNAVSGVAQILNKPSIPAAQVNSDWNAVSGVAQILNKPVLATVATTGSYTDLINKPVIPAAQVNSDWNASAGVAKILNQPPITWTSGTPNVTTVTGNLTITSLLTITNPTGGVTVIHTPATGIHTASADGHYAAGAHFTAGGWIADATAATFFSLVTGTGQVIFYINTGLTVGSSFSGTQVVSIDSGGNIVAIGRLTSGVKTVAALAAPATAGAGARMFVSDATATTFYSIVAGGGTNSVPVFCDGTNWRIG
jgi:hypothetical protein